MLRHGHCLEEGPAEIHRSHCFIQSALFMTQPYNRTGPASNEQPGLQRGSSGLTSPPSNSCTCLGSGKGQLSSLQTPHILDTNCSNFYLQVSASERYFARTSC
ncbi:hypothetical protein AMECASPLE_038560 [Ameca splendens]|uniref:Uncharacterized protein n=1 Tax=Ameca splendens TaxID=208324 RepID=A0ABV0Y836_9TELE